MKLNGKVALITGAASGIGHAIAKRYVEADGRVVIADLDPTKAAQGSLVSMDVDKRSWAPSIFALRVRSDGITKTSPHIQARKRLHLHEFMA